MDQTLIGKTVTGRSGYGGSTEVTGKVVKIEITRWGTSAQVELDNKDTDWASCVYEHDPYFHEGGGWYLAR